MRYVVIFFVSALSFVMATTNHTHQKNKEKPNEDITIYQTPDVNSTIIGTINPNNGVTLLPNNWVKVKDLKTNTVGWVKQEQIQNILGQNNIAVKTTIAGPTGNYHSITEVQTIQDNDTQMKKNHEKIKKHFKQSMQYFNKVESMTNSMFDNMFSDD